MIVFAPIRLIGVAFILFIICSALSVLGFGKIYGYYFKRVKKTTEYISSVKTNNLFTGLFKSFSLIFIYVIYNYTIRL